MLKKIKVKFNRDDFVYSEKLDIMSSNVCESILPVSMIECQGSIQDTITAYYDFTGYRRLSSYKEIGAENMLALFEKIVEAIEKCNEHLFFPEEYVMNLDTVYVDSHFAKVKFAYAADKTKVGLNKKLIYLIHQMKQISTEAGKVYLDTISHYLKTEELSIPKLKLLIIIIKREIRTLELN